MGHWSCSGAGRWPGAPRAGVGVMHVPCPSFDLGCHAAPTPTRTGPPEPDRLAAPPTERMAYAPAPPGEPTALDGDVATVAHDDVQHINYRYLTNAGEPLDVLA